jgi:general secretion pathway protein C
MNQKHVSRLFWAVKALLAGILLYVAVAVIVTPLYLGKALKPQRVSGGERVPEVPPVESPSRPSADVSAIIENDLFAGAAGMQTDLARPAIPDAAADAGEDLGLRLIGAIAGQSDASRAIIQNTKTNAALPYKVGDVVAGAKVESIESDRVALRYEGRRRVLRLQTGTAASEKGRPQEPPAPDKDKDKAVTNQATSTEPLRPQGLAGMSYIEDVFHKAKIEPYVQDGQTRGLKITGLDETPLTRMIGLKNGDVVQMVNGQTLTNKQKAFQVLQKAKSQPKLQIQLLRDGKTKELSLDLK